MLPFIFIIGYLFGYADATFHIVTIAIGKLGQMLLSTMVRERRGVQRKIVLWCFDDLLQVQRDCVVAVAVTVWWLWL